MSLTGFDPGEIDNLLALDDEEKANATPPLPESPVSQPGDLWLLGSHRVLCGDATSLVEHRDASSVAALGEELERLGPAGLWLETARCYLHDHGFVQSGNESLSQTMARALGISTHELRICIAENRVGAALQARFRERGIAADNTT